MAPTRLGSGASRLLIPNERKNASNEAENRSNSFIANIFITHLFLVDSTLSNSVTKSSQNEEGQQLNKILYFYPESTDDNKKNTFCGIIEGLIFFTRLFTSSDKSLRSIYTNKRIFSVLECEPKLWLVMVFEPMPNSPSNDLSDSVQESVLQAILKDFYTTFYLFHGTARDIFKNSPTQLQDLLNDFTLAFIETIKFEKLSFLMEMKGFHFGPVNCYTFLSIQLFLNNLQESFSIIRYISLLHNSLLVYNGLPHEDMKVLYSYLVGHNNGSVSDFKLMKFPYGRMPTAAAQLGGGSSSYGRCISHDFDGFLFGPYKKTVFSPTIHLTDGSTARLVVLMHQGIMLIMVLKDDEAVDNLNLLLEIKDAAISSAGGLSALAPDLSSQHSTIIRKDHDKFLYYNYANNAVRISNNAVPSGSGTEVLNLNSNKLELMGSLHNLIQSHNRFHSPKCKEKSDTQYIEQAFVKSKSSGWIHSRVTMNREFYILGDDQRANISKAQEHALAVADANFNGIFLG